MQIDVDQCAAGHPSPFGPFSLLQAPWLDPAYLNLAQLTSFGQFGTSLGNITVLPNGGPKPWDHSAMRRDPLALIKGQSRKSLQILPQNDFWFQNFQSISIHFNPFQSISIHFNLLESNCNSPTFPIQF